MTQQASQGPAPEIEACPGCECEPEITSYLRRGDIRVGYRCACGVVVVDGRVVFFDPIGP